MIINVFLYLVSFALIWYGAGIIVRAVERLAHRLNISSFAISFFVLGILTSIPEVTIGINSVIDQRPDIFIGNLIGASIVMFVFVIPVLAILGNGIKLDHQLNAKNLLLALAVTASPIFFVLDKKVTPSEGIFLIVFYFILFYFLEKRKGMFEKIRDQFMHDRSHAIMDLGFILVGAIIVFLSSKIIVDKTIYFSQTFNVSSFMISLLVLSIGTNLPELSLAIRSVSLGKKDIALGDYIGSAAANTLIFGVLTIVNGKEIYVTNHFVQALLFMIVGFGLFFMYSRSKNDISRVEGLALLIVYIMFVAFEITAYML